MKKREVYHFTDSCLGEKNLPLSLRFEGTIRNLKRLKSEIGTKKNDPEAILLDGFERFQTALFGKIEGDYTIWVLDRRRGKLYLTRDFAGKRPFYYHLGRKGILASGSLTALKEYPDFYGGIDTTGLLHYLRYGFILAPYTIYEKTYKIRQGCAIVYDFSTRKCEEVSYWDLNSLYTKTESITSEEELLAQIETLLDKSILRMLESCEATAGVMLSGGYDSSLVASLLFRHLGRNLEAFTIGFEEKEYDESRYAAKIAEHLGIRHHIHLFGKKEAQKIVPSLATVYEEPFADFGATPTLMLAKIAKKAGIDALFVGDGGDEVFATADNLEQLRLFRNLQIRHKGWASRFLNLLDPCRLPSLAEKHGLINRYAKFRMLLQSESIPQMIKKKEMTFLPQELDALLHLDSRSFANAFDLIRFDTKCEPANQVTGTYFHTTMADGELVKTFGALDHVGITPLSPYLEQKLIALLASTPSSIKLKNGTRKYLLKTLAHRHLPKTLLDRPKSGFNIPFGDWMRGILKEDLDERLDEQNIASTGFFDPEFVTTLKRRFEAGDDFVQYRLWNLYLFMRWYDTHHPR